MSNAHPFSFLIVGWRHRRLIGQLSWRQIQSRYRDSVLGFAWALLEPLAMLAIYTFVFSFVFQARWGALSTHHGDFALFLFSGLTIYSLFADSVNAAPTSIVSQEIFVKHLVFPTEILAWVSVVVGLFKLAISSLLLLVFCFGSLGHLPLSVLALPVIIIPAILMTLGVTWVFSSLGVFLRDLGQVVGLLTTALLFLSPIFYPVSVIPERYQPIYYLNPFAGVLEMAKLSLFEGEWPDPQALAVLLLVGWLVAWVGFGWFARTKASFADVL